MKRTRNISGMLDQVSRRVKKAQSFAKKWSVLTTFMLSFAAFIFSLLAFWNTRIQIGNARKTAHLDVTPNVSCSLRIPLPLRETNGINNPEVVILNRGPIKVVSFSVLHEIFTFFPQTTNYSQWITEGDQNHEFLFFEEELLVSKPLKTELIATTDSAVHVFDLSYFRESDMQSFTRREIFFVEGNRILDHREFLKHSFYISMMRRIQSDNPQSKLRREGKRPK